VGLAAARRFGAASHRVALVSRSIQHRGDLVAELARENVHARGFTADVLNTGSLTTALREASDTLGPIEILQSAESAYAQMLHDALADENIHVTQLIVPGAIRPDAEHDSPDALAERIYAMHSERAFRHDAEPMPA
jgi:hypothetical protein